MSAEAQALETKVILIGNPALYHLLFAYDEDFNELFKVKADFDSRMARTPETMVQYAAFIAACQKDDNLLPFDNEGVAKVVEYGSRLAAHKEKLSTRFSEVADLLRESDYWAKKEGSSLVGAKHVVKALDERIYRVNRIEETLQEMMVEDTLIVNTSGEKVGQVNGLAVLDLGDYSFGKPSRISATW